MRIYPPQFVVKSRRLFYAIYLIVILFATPFSEAIKCFSCSGPCHRHDLCNCMLDQCEADYCFAEVIYNPYVDSNQPHYHLVKGCAHRPAELRMRCDNRFDKHTVHCICDNEDFCNRVVAVPHANVVYPHWNVTCHECDRRDANCGRTCRGEYCYRELSSGQQMCGYGMPMLEHTYRSMGLFDNMYGETCITTVAGNQWKSECICNTNACNQIGGGDARPRTRHSTPSMSAAVIVVADHAKHRPVYRCYSCQHHGSDQILPSECRSENSYCTGQYCTLTWHTRVKSMAAMQVTGSRVAGCLNTTNPMYVMVGCSQRRNGDKEEKIECVCMGDLCNNDVHTAYLHGAAVSLITHSSRRTFAICIVLTYFYMFRFQ